MILLYIPAISGAMYNDVLSLVSAAGCGLMFLAAAGGERWRLLKAIGEWSAAPVVFGIFFQVMMYITAMAPERIGFVLPLPPGWVNGLFGLSLFLWSGSQWLERNKQESNNKP